jgi:hypothetical protein
MENSKAGFQTNSQDSSSTLVKYILKIKNTRDQADGNLSKSRNQADGVLHEQKSSRWSLYK